MALCVGYLERSFQKVHIFFMKICYIPTFNLPWCATSWRRALEFGKVVSRYHKVSFLCPEAAVPKLRDMTRDVETEIFPVRILPGGYIGRALARILALKSWDIVHTFKPLPEIFPVGLVAKYKRALWITDLDDLEGGQGYNRNSALWKRKAMDFFEWMVPTFADGVTVASQGLKQFYAKYDPFYIPNGADPEIFHPLRRDNSKPTVLFMGLFHPEIVDADMVIRAIAKVSESHKVRLLMIGDGDERRRAEKLANELKIDATFTGHIDDVPSIIGSADIGVISFRDNMLNQCKCPLRLFEYMACGLPIVSTRIGEPACVLKDDAGLLVDPDAESIARGILTLMEDRNLSNKMRDRARQLILEKYNWENLGRILAWFYENLVSSRTQSKLQA